MYMAPAHNPLGTDLTPLHNPYHPKNGPKRSFFGPKFCRRSKFERIFEKSQIFFRFRADFRKKVSKRGQNRGFDRFTLFHPIFRILPYFGQHLGVRRLNLGFWERVFGNGDIFGSGVTLIPNLPQIPVGHILGQATYRACRGPKGSSGDKAGTKNVTNGPKTAFL